MAKPAPEGTIYERLGGAPGCHALSSALYANIAHDPVIRPFFPGKSLRCAIEAFAAFLIQFLGGPADQTQRRSSVSLRESHLRFRIQPEHREAWLRNMYAALAQIDIAEPVRASLHEFFTAASLYLVNVGPAVSQPVTGDLAEPWHTQLVADNAIAALRSPDPARAIRLTETCAQHSRPLFVALLMEMIASPQPELLAYATARLRADTTLIEERSAGRTFLHVAAATGNLELLALLLHLGLDPNIADAGRHTPLYAVANQCNAHTAAAVVRALVNAGAAVDASDGVQRCTPLHMAARRDNAEVAAALLDCGAAIEARDRSGDTPLRRAVNCGQPAVAALLLDRGADPDSVGSNGLTPKSAARTPAIRRLFSADRRPRPSSTK